MKKRDIKYIIKRIIIGVGIFFCIAFIKKCDVKAESLTDVYYNVFSNSSVSGNDYPGSLVSFSTGNTDYTFQINNYNINITDNKNNIPLSDYDYLSIIFKDSNNNYILFALNNFQDYESHLFFEFDSLNITSTSFDFYLNGVLQKQVSYQAGFNQFTNFMSSSNSLSSLESIYSNYGATNWGNFNYNDSVYNNVYYFMDDYSNMYDLLNYLVNNYEIVHTSTEIKIDDTLIHVNIPSYYSELDMSTHEGVYFVPKNYSTVETILNSNNDRVIPFNYYYKGNFTEGYFPLEDYNKVVFFYYDYVSRENFSYNETWFPLQQNIDATTYDYYALLIQNNDINSFYQHLEQKIYYDSRYFDYYFIDDFSSYDNTITIIDKSGGTAQISVQINSSLKQKFKEGSQENNTASYIADDMLHAVNNNTLGEYLNFITIPFNFLNSIPNATCIPIQLPIPFVGGTIQLPCISSVLQQNVGGIYNVILIVINGLLVYKITMRNIDTFTDVLKADDDKIEVVDL